MRPGAAGLSRRTRILASAGTGKTFRLTSHFLALLFAGADPQRILATTFTRKATGEILERVLMRLAAAARDRDQRAVLGTQIGIPGLDAARCREQLQRLVRHLHRFRVCTLDAFFVRVATLFGLELGLPPGWSIAETSEAEEMRAEAVDRLLTSSAPEALLGLLRGLEARPAGRAVHARMLALLDTGSAAFLDAHPEAWEWLPVPAAPSPTALAQARRALEDFALPRTRKGTPVKLWVNAIDAILRSCGSGHSVELLGNGLVKKIMAGEVIYARHTIGEDLREMLEPIFARLAHEQLSLLANSNRSIRALLGELDGHYRQLLRERGKLRFEDVPALLDPRDGDSPVPVEDLWFRLDGQLDHLLLDELQDTSALQWRVLEPLASEVVSQEDPERSFFSVGDVKQCVYAWRQAEPRLLQELEQLLPGLEPAETLALSYRSSPVVLDTINRVFGSIGEQALFVEGPLDILRRDAERWRAGFETHRAHHRNLPGGALLIEPRAAVQGDDPKAPHAEIALAAERVEALLARHPRARVGILFRSNKPIPAMMHRLARSGWHASGEGGNPLTDSVATLHLLALLVLADHPGHTRAALAITTSAFGSALDWPREAWRDKARAAEVAIWVRRRLAVSGYGAFCASFSDLVAAGYGVWDQRRFAQLVDLAEAWHDAGVSRPSRFVAHVLGARVEDPTASNIQCMTVHAAKGLEFDAVILPELGGALAREPAALLTHRPGPGRLLDAVCVKPSAQVAALSPDLEVLYSENKGRSFQESLSVLYVAMSRAKQWLELIVPRPAPRASKASAAVLLRQALGADEPDADGILWQHPDNDASAPWPCDRQEASPVAAPQTLPRGLGLRPARAARGVVMRSPSDSESSSEGVAGLLRAPGRRALRLGTLVHRLLSEIEWLEDLDASDAALDDLLTPQEADARVRHDSIGIFRAGLAWPAVADLLRRARHRGDREVAREQRFCIELPEPDGTPTLLSGMIDRKVLHRQDGKLIGADVIDFKSDRITREAVEARSAVYHAQMAAYARVVAAQTGLPRSAIRTHLVFLVPGLVRTR